MASHLTLFYMKRTYSFQYDETVILHCRYKKYNKKKKATLHIQRNNLKTRTS